MTKPQAHRKIALTQDSFKVARRGAVILAIACSFLAAHSNAANQGERHVLPGHVPAAVANLPPLGPVPASNRLHLAIGLPLRNKQALNELLRQLYDPASTNFHHYLTPAQFTARFGPPEQDYQAVIHFAKANHLDVAQTYDNRVLVDVSGTVADIEKAFSVTLHRYSHPTEPREFYASDVEPSVDSTVPVLCVGGLDSFALPRPVTHRLRDSSSSVAASGSAPGGNYMGRDFRNAYVPGVQLDGSGQMVGLVEFDGYYTNDIIAYERQAGLPPARLQNILLTGFTNGPTTNALNIQEVSLDIEMVISMATNLASLVVFEAAPDNSSRWFDVLNSMVASNQIQQFSSSWLGMPINDPNPSGEESLLEQLAGQMGQQMIAQGQSFFQASGDGDAWTNTIPWPVGEPYVTTVGGTRLNMSGLGSSYASETVWNEGFLGTNAWQFTHNGYAGSGGGISAKPIPWWQSNVETTVNSGSISNRNIPDVAMVADNIWIAYDKTNKGGVNGTSCAAPLWAGFTALVNQFAAAHSASNVGFFNPALYRIGQGPHYNACFHDITTGNNTWLGSPNRFYATSGYDLCTGWGTPAGGNLILALALGEPPLVTGPRDQNIPLGGAATFSVSVRTNVLAYQWQFNGVDLTDGGNIAGSSTSTLTVTHISAADAGTYSVLVSNAELTMSTVGVLTPYTRISSSQLVQNGGFESGDFSGWTLSGNTFLDSVSTASPYVHSGAHGAQLGSPGSDGYLSQTLPTMAGQSYLLSLWLDKPSGTIPGQFLVVWDGVTNLDEPNLGVTTWTNLQMIVTASHTNTLLEFAFRNDNGFMGLDDVSVQPFSPTFQMTFDDLPPLTNGAMGLPALYHQLTWSNFGYLNAESSEFNPSGFHAGMVSPPNVAYNGGGNSASIISPSAFSLISAYLTAAWNDGLQLETKGYLGPALKYHETNTLSATNPTLIAFNYVGVTEVDFNSFGGTNHGYHGNGTFFAMDNLTVITNLGWVGPQFRFPPENTAALPGGTATFSALVTGTPPLSYQWQFNGMDLSGSTNTTLTISNAQPRQAGNYSLFATNLYGSSSSSAATLSILDVPVSFVTATGAFQYTNGLLRLELTNLTGQGPVVIEASTNLSSWSPIFTNPSTFGTIQVIDSTAGNFPRRYYRASTPMK